MIFFFKQKSKALFNVFLFLIFLSSNGCKKKEQEVILNSNPLLKNYSPYLFTIGDSQTECVNNGNSDIFSYISRESVSAFPGANAYHHLKQDYQWMNLINSTENNRLSIVNLGVGGSRMSWSGGSGSISFNDEMSHFNMLGKISPEWTGIVATMMGWNNNVESLTSITDKNQFFEVYKTSTMAVIAGLLIDGYAGISYNGWDRNKNKADNWITNGTNGQNVSQNNSNTFFSPFQLNAEPNANRYFTRLGQGNYLQFTIKKKRALALFYETGNDYYGVGTSRGATFDVLVNGVLYGSYDTSYTVDVDFFPQVIWIENLPENAVVRINQTDKDSNGVKSVVRFLAYGWVETTNSLTDKKLILIGSTSGNTFRHSADQLARFGQATSDAVACFGGFNVYYADIGKNWNTATDQQSDDLSHITDVGNRHIAQAFLNNMSQPQNGSSANLVKLF